MSTDLKNKAIIIRDETVEGANTAARVGEWMVQANDEKADNSIAFSGEITNEDEIKTYGIYRTPQTLSAYPYVLFVFPSGTNVYQARIYDTAGTPTFETRVFNGTSWSVWTDKLKNTFKGNADSGLTNDDIKIPGTYVNNISTYPNIIFVTKISDTNIRQMRMYMTNDKPKFEYRVFNGTSWSAWTDLLTELLSYYTDSLILVNSTNEIQWYGNARFYWDTDSKKLSIKGTIPTIFGNNIVVRLNYKGKVIRINNTVLEREIITTPGHHQLLLPVPSVVQQDYSLNDITISEGSTWNPDTHLKLGHLLYATGMSSFIIDGSSKISTTSKLISYGSAINNSIGENSFANGIRQELKILGFGNSFMRNSVHYLSVLAKGANVNLTIGNLYTGGTNLSDHLTALNTGSNPYEYHKYVNGVKTIGEYNQTAARGLKDERWDAVVLHQYTPWTEPFQPYLEEVMKKIIEILGYCPKFYLNATWAGRDGDVENYYGFETEEEMRQAMLTATQNAAKDVGILDLSVIPTGTAIQNARTLPFTDDAAYNRYVNNSGDEHHLNIAGGFIASCTIYETIIYPLNGIHCSETTFRLPTAGALPPSGIVMSALVTDANYLQFCNSAIKAVEKPNEITTIT